MDRFTRIHSENKTKITLYLPSQLKDKIVCLRNTRNISISELVEALYQQHKELIEQMQTLTITWQRGKNAKGKGRYSNNPLATISIMITPSALAFFDEQAKNRDISRSKVIEFALHLIYK